MKLSKLNILQSDPSEQSVSTKNHDWNRLTAYEDDVATYETAKMRTYLKQAIVHSAKMTKLLRQCNLNEAAKNLWLKEH